MRKGYSRGQIVLHWAIALLLIIQWRTSGAVADVLAALEARGSVAPLVAEPAATLHMVAGGLTFLLVVLLLASRYRRGVPPPQAEAPAIARTLEWLTRTGLYLTLLALPVTGLLSRGAFGLHRQLAALLLLFVLVHLGLALWHALVRRDRTILRMLVRER